MRWWRRRQARARRRFWGRALGAVAFLAALGWLSREVPDEEIIGTFQTDMRHDYDQGVLTKVVYWLAFLAPAEGAQG